MSNFEHKLKYDSNIFINCAESKPCYIEVQIKPSLYNDYNKVWKCRRHFKNDILFE